MSIPIFIAKCQHAVGQVAPGGNQFAVVARNELFPVPIAVFRFGHVDGQVVAQRVGVVARQKIAAPDGPVARAADLLPFQVHELVGGHIIRQRQRHTCFTAKNFDKLFARAHQFGGPL